MADLAEIREGLRANLSTITDCQVSAYMLSTSVSPSLQVIGPDEVTYDLSMHRGLDFMTIVIQGIVGSPTDQGRQVVLDQWLAPTGDKSVKTAVEADHTLGGLVASTRVARVSGYRIYPLQTGLTLGAEWFVEIHNPGS
jgi:hypothetical protein